MESPAEVLAAQPAHEPSQPTCITHPTTKQLMAPGSRVWPYFTRHRKFGIHWIGPKDTYPGNPENTDSVLKAEDMGPRKKNTANKAAKKPAKKTISVANSSNIVSPPTTPNTTTAKSKSIAPPMSRVNQTRSIEDEYTELLVRRTNLRQSGKINQADIIQAAINLSLIWGWSKLGVINVVERLEEDIGKGKEGKFSPKMMEVVGEFERLGFQGGLNELRSLREIFKGEFYAGVSSTSVGNDQKWRRAPGFLMLIQAGLSAAFLKTLDNAEDEDEEFHMGVYDGKAVLYFKTPNKVCVEERNYLSQMSRFGTAGTQNKKIAACPGIERAIKEGEKKLVLEKVQDQVEGGREIIQLATALFRKLEEETDGAGEERGGSGGEAAMESMGDEGFLVLEHVYRKKVGLPILVGDEMGGEEEEEEEEEEGREGEEEEEDKDEEGDEEKEEEGELTEGVKGLVVRGGACETEAERKTLVVTLMYRRE